MEIIKERFSAPSCDGKHTLSGVVIRPRSEEIKGYYQIVHGMTEHIARYERIMTDLAMEGWLCFGHDHLGHGGTVDNDSELGDIGSAEINDGIDTVILEGWELLVQDVRVFFNAVFERYSGAYGEDKPYVLMGHSMGSFIVREAAVETVCPDKLIIMGTGGSNPAAGAGLAIIGLIKAIKGEKHISPLVEKLAFGSYNKRFGGGTPEDPSPWLTRDEDERKRYYADKYCTFKFTVSAMGDLIKVMKRVNSPGWYDSLSTSVPILLLSGEEDPVGNYGRGVKEVEAKLLEQGINVSSSLYPEARHEILNDSTYEDVKRDILEFCRV